MPNRILRDWTEADVRKELNRTKGIVFKDIISIKMRILEIEKLQISIPKVKSGHPLGILKHSISCEKRRLKIRLSRLNGKSHSFQDAMILINSVGGKCSNCGSTSNPTIDHVIPVSKGGHDGIENLQVLCGKCNCKKNNKWATRN